MEGIPPSNVIALPGRPVTRPVPREKVRLVKPGYEIVKRAADLVLCSLLLPVALPVIGLAAAAVWLTDRGPIFFMQERTGRGGRRFPMYKIRTMVTNAADMKEELAHLNSRTGPDFKIVDDPRVTKVGKFLRRSSIDELPQIFSVLRGDMSLVGPRPTSFSPDTYTLWHTERLEVPPGITGLWQVESRGAADFDERVRLDIDYVRRRSLALDAWILLRTMGPVFSGKGAH